MTTQRHDDPTINAFLVDGDYADIDEWMADSDYVTRLGLWFYPSDYADSDVAGALVDPEGAIAGAIEACGFMLRQEYDDLSLSDLIALAHQQQLPSSREWTEWLEDFYDPAKSWLIDLLVKAS